MNEPSDRILERAMDLLMQLRHAPDDAALRGRIAAWVAADPDHARAWELAENTWRLLGELPPDRMTEARLKKRSRNRRPPLRRTAMGLAAVGVAACLLLVLAPSLQLRMYADHVTATGETRQVVLSDGTRVHMGPRSAIRATYTPGNRTVSLLTGEAFFEVRHDPERRFVVDAEGLDVSVIGTAFDVRITPASVSVAVRNGAVGVYYGRIGPPLSERIGVGDMLSVDRATGVATRRRVDPGEVAAWRDGRLFVEDATIAEVVAELGRYHTGWIFVGDKLAAQRVTGLYDLRDAGRAVAALVQPFGGRVLEVTPLLHVLSMP